MNKPNFSLLEKLKILIEVVGRLDSDSICATAEMFIKDITADVFSGNTDKVPDEVWDYMKTLPKEIQLFMLSGFASSIITSEREKTRVMKENGGKIPEAVIARITDVLSKQLKFEQERTQNTEEKKPSEIKPKSKIHLF